MEGEGAVDLGPPEEGHGFKYDVLVVGGGSGGLACGKACAAYEKKVCVLDFVKPSPPGSTWGLGGTCVNVGCIPKKLFHQAGLLGTALSDSVFYGWKEHEQQFEWDVLRDNVRSHIKSLNFGYRAELSGKGIAYLNAFGEFVDPHTMECTKKNGEKVTVSARRIILAMGGRPVYPDIPGALEYGITSDDIFTLDRDPGKTLCVGASYTALETAGFLTSVGKDATVMVRSIPLRGFDQQMAEQVVVYMQNHGTKFIRVSVPTKIEKQEDGKLLVTYKNLESGEESQEAFDTVMFAIGRHPETSRMAIERSGVKCNDDGRIIVDKWDRSTTQHIYAIGDVCVDALELTPVAIMQGRMLAKRLFGGSTQPMDFLSVATTVFTPIEYGSVGYTEEMALEKFGEDNIEVFHSNIVPLEWTLPHREESMCYIKLICLLPENLKVVGFHIMCPNAGEITQGVAVAVRLGVTKEQFDNTVGIHPTIAEEMTTLTVTKRSGDAIETGGC